MSSCSISQCGTGSGNFPQPGDPDLNSPILTAVAQLNGIRLSWTYPGLNAHALAHIVVYRATVDNFALASEIAVATGSWYLDPVAPVTATRYWYWIRLVSVNGTLGEIIGPATALMGTVSDYVLDLIGDGLTLANLGQHIRDKVAQIITNAANLAQEIQDRIAAVGVLGSMLETLQADLDEVDTLIGQEIIDRVDGDEALLSQINYILALSGDNAAAILTEQTVRADADSALANLITIVEAQTGDNTAAIIDEATARTNADEALASQINAIVVESGSGSLAAIAEEAAARATADSALASQITTLTAQVGDNAAAITDEAETRADQYESIATTLTNHASQLDDNAALIEDETSARTTADAAISNQVSLIQAASNTNAAAIASETTARTNADSAMASQINGLIATNGANSAAIANEISVRTSQVSSLSSIISSMQSTVGNNTAAISNEATVRANADTAMANQVNSLTSTVNGFSSSISTMQSITNGLAASYELRVDGNGHVASIGLYGNPSGSSIIFRGDQIGFGYPGYSNEFPLIIGNVNGVPRICLNAQTFIADLTVNTLKIEDNAVTVPASIAVGGGTLINQFGTIYEVGQITVPFGIYPGGNVLVMASVSFKLYDTGNETKYEMAIFHNGIPYGIVSQSVVAGYEFFMTVQTVIPNVGPYNQTFSVRARRISGSTRHMTGSTNITVIGVRK